MALFACLFGAFGLQLISNTGGPPPGRTGAPGESSCQVSCHNTFDLNSGSGIASISSNAPVAGYTPGETYSLTFSIKESGIGKFGFEGMVYSPSADASTGDLVITDSDNTQESASATREYVLHTAAGTAATDSQTWVVDWVAPAAGEGNVEVYAAFNAANQGNGNKNDHIYTKKLVIAENVATSILNEEWEPNFRWFQDQSALHLHLSLKKAGDVSLVLRDLTGKLLWQEDAFSSSEEYSTHLNTSNMSEGIYVVTVQAPAHVYSRKIVIK